VGPRAVTGRIRLLLIGLAIAIAVVAFMVAKPSSGKHTAATTTGRPGGAGAAPPGSSAIPHILVRGGRPVAGIRTIAVNEGERVRFEVTSDVAEEVHIHGYDLHKDVAAGGTVGFDFSAAIAGVFVIELEARSEQIASLKVEP
jgi:heme/copper-type cytochrome/quinol oxidase subunit 2